VTKQSLKLKNKFATVRVQKNNASQQHNAQAIWLWARDITPLTITQNNLITGNMPLYANKTVHGGSIHVFILKSNVESIGYWQQSAPVEE